MDEKFGTFLSTYKKTSFLMCISMMYPSVNTRKKRILGFIVTTLGFLPMLLVLIYNVLSALINLDVMNLTHHSTVVGPYFGGLLKIVLSNYRAFEGQKIIDEIDRDYALYNTLPKRYQAIARSWINNSLAYAESFWNLMVVLSAFTWISLPIMDNIKSLMFEDVPRRINVHDAFLPFLEPEERFDTPYFEFMFGQTIFGVFIFASYYSGFESFLALSLNHACLKIEINCEALVDALRCKNEKQKMKKIENVIMEQLRFFEYVETVQRYFNWYLGTVLFATLIQIGTCLYHITEIYSYICAISSYFLPNFTTPGQQEVPDNFLVFDKNEETDYQRMALTTVSIGAIYLPCYYASKLKYTANDSATKFYLAGWHKIYCLNIRKTLLFMIARAQIPVCIFGFSFITFEMQLFVSILQSAYSIYTLLCT